VRKQRSIGYQQRNAERLGEVYKEAVYSISTSAVMTGESDVDIMPPEGAPKQECGS
jgi:hypothetical protein